MAIGNGRRTQEAEAVAPRSKLVPGATFPDHELTGHDRKRYRLSESRPDWDLSDPELRANWEGDKSKHYPYVRP